MSKLHIYRTIGGFTTKVADGDGTPSGTQDFNVQVTSGTVKKGTVYEIRQGQSPTGPSFNCLTGATTGGAASFHEVAASALTAMSEEHFGATLALHSALAATKKSVIIQIAQGDLETLKGADYMLCFAKKVGDAAYNVVWQSYAKYLVTNTFSWTPQYQLFGCNQFNDRVEVDVTTNLVTIGLGEQSTLDSAGVLGDPSTGGPDVSISMVNQYGSIHPGLNQLATALDGSQQSTPIYVAPNPMVTGSAVLTPVEMVLVWFEQDIETSTMFSAARSNSIEIDLTFSSSETRLYKDQKWSRP